MPEEIGLKDARPPLVVLAGPTGVGKTEVSLELAERFGAEIINADSIGVYRYLDIGSAKPSPAERARAPHHLIDVVDPDKDFDAAAFLRLARPLIERLHRQKNPILVVGGTGFYLRSLLYGLFEGPGRNDAVRARLRKEARALGGEVLHARLAKVDPTAAARIHVNDLVRIERALEVYEISGRPISSFQTEHGLEERPYRVLFFCLNLPREELYDRIETRAEIMFERGLVEEVRDLLDRGYSPDLKPFRSIGYRQAVLHIQGRYDLDRARAETAKESRRYAKRQLTWYRSQPGVLWRLPNETKRITGEVDAFFSLGR